MDWLLAFPNNTWITIKQLRFFRKEFRIENMVFLLCSLGVASNANPGSSINIRKSVWPSKRQPGVSPLHPPPTKKKYPWQLKEILARVDGYYASPDLMPTLAYQCKTVNKDGSFRQNRSELRESQVVMLKAVYSMTDWASARVGIPLYAGHGEFKPYTHIDIAKEMNRIGNSARIWTIKDDAQKDLRPNSAYWAAWHSLEKSAAWESFRVYEKNDDGDLRAKPAIKKLNVDFIVAATGLSFKTISKLRTWSSRSTRKKRDSWKSENPDFFDQTKARQRLYEKSQKDGVARKNRVKKTEHSDPPSANKPTDIQREVNQYMCKLLADHPEQSKERAWLLQKVTERYPSYRNKH